MRISPTRGLLCPNEFNPQSLSVLASSVRNARIVGIGEGAHFVEEFSLARASLIRYLVEEHRFNVLALECSTSQANRISEWLYDSRPSEQLSDYAGPLTVAIYGSLLVWLQSYLKETAQDMSVVGIDLPNTLNATNELEILADEPTDEINELMEILEPVTGESAVVSSAQWSGIPGHRQDRALALIARRRLREISLTPRRLRNNSQQSKLQAITTIQYTLESLRSMAALFEGTAPEGETSIREHFMARSVEKLLEGDSDQRMIIAAHNNHIQKTELSFAGELTAVPMGQHLAARDDYRALGLTHLGESVPEMHFPAESSVVGFTVAPAPTSPMTPGSLESYLTEVAGNNGQAVAVSDRQSPRATSIRSQSARVQTKVDEAFDGVICVPQASQDELARL